MTQMPIFLILGLSVKSATSTVFKNTYSLIVQNSSGYDLQSLPCKHVICEPRPSLDCPLPRKPVCSDNCDFHFSSCLCAKAEVKLEKNWLNLFASRIKSFIEKCLAPAGAQYSFCH